MLRNRAKARQNNNKTKCILFCTKHSLKMSKTHIKQYHTVTYLYCSLDESLSGESMALKFTNRF